MIVCMKDAVLSADTSESTSKPETQSSKNICAKTWTTEGKLKIWWTHDKEGKQTRREGKAVTENSKNTSFSKKNMKLLVGRFNC